MRLARPGAQRERMLGVLVVVACVPAVVGGERESVNVANIVSGRLDHVGAQEEDTLRVPALLLARMLRRRNRMESHYAHYVCCVVAHVQIST